MRVGTGTLGPRRMAKLAWALCALMTCLAVVLFGTNMLREGGSQTVLEFVGDALFSLAMPVVFSIVAAVIVSRQAHNTIGWLLLVPVGMFLVEGVIRPYLQRLAPSSPAPTLPLLLLVWFSAWSWLLLIFPLLHILLLFPDGQPPTPHWRWVRVAASAWPALFVLLVTFSQPIHPDNMPDLALDNPIGVLGNGGEWLFDVWGAGLAVLTVLCVAAVFARYRRANITERKQIKWLLYACAMFLMVSVSGTVSGLNNSASVAGGLWQVCFGLSLVAFPAAIGIAILRYRLYDIDVIINRTLVYTLLSAALALIYFGSVVLLQALLRPFAGENNQLVTVVSTLLIAALFQPLRRRIQANIDRRFFRRKYDAVRILAAFSADLRDEVEMITLTHDLLAVVDETLQPAHVSLWLRQPTRR